MTEEGPADSAVPNRSIWLVGFAVFAMTVVAGLFLTAGSREPQRTPLATPPESRATTIEEGARIDIPTLGLSVLRPQGWVTITADENAQNIRGVQMNDREFQELAARYANSPVVAIAKYKEPYADLNPSFKVSVRPLGGFAKFAPEDILTAALPTFSRAFDDVQLLEGPRSARVSGRNAAYARISYTLRAKDVAVLTISEIWIVPKGSIFFMIGAGTRADEKNGTRAEVRKILDNLRIE